MYERVHIKFDHILDFKLDNSGQFLEIKINDVEMMTTVSGPNLDVIQVTALLEYLDTSHALLYLLV